MCPPTLFRSTNPLFRQHMQLAIDTRGHDDGGGGVKKEISLATLLVRTSATGRMTTDDSACMTYVSHPYLGISSLGRLSW
mmetsp:Transcript_12841/g.35458  ORF Transcript_12841/g.35458 Transcript_12841/m.35458 type:complete len:80 (-) Transcript_12841:556-795(-)